MSTQQQIRNRLSSVKNILHITQAMEVVAGVQFRKLMKKMEQFQFYSSQLTEMMGRLAHAVQGNAFTLLEKRKTEKIAVIVVASDKGLCGTYNDYLLKAADQFLQTLAPNPVELFLFGHKADNHFKHRHWPVRKKIVDWPRAADTHVQEWCNEYIAAFEQKEFDELWVIYTHFINLSSREIRKEQLLPLTLDTSNKITSHSDVIFEPNPQMLFEQILPVYFHTKLQAILFDAHATELISRLISMKAATKNAEEMIEELTLIKNKNRQYNITKEILEITAGAEGLR